MIEAYGAAQRVERFLNTRKPMEGNGLDPELVAQVGSKFSDHELVDLTTADLRVLIEIAESALDLLELHCEVVTHKGKPYEYRFCDHCNVRYPCDTVVRLRGSTGAA